MVDWNKLKVVDLKAELKNRGLAQTGLKPALVARLTEADSQDGSESDATIQEGSTKADSTTAARPDTSSPIQATSGLNNESTLEAPDPLPAQTSKQSSDLGTAQESAAPEDSKTLKTQTEETDIKLSETLASSRTPEKHDNHDSALPSVEPLESIEDRLKRKRRSNSPPPTASDGSRKRLRQDSDNEDSEDRAGASEENPTRAEKPNTLNDENDNATGTEVVSTGENVVSMSMEIIVGKEESRVEGSHGAREETSPVVEGMDIDDDRKSITEDTSATNTLEDASLSRTRDTRFKNLFPAETTQQTTGSVQSKAQDSPPEATEVEQERDISPAMHPATAALYIRDIMRPLNPSQLKLHIASLATPPGSDSDPEAVVDFYLDPIRTHCFVSLKNTSAASRVRNALHSRIWPEERNRKPLWVDFIPAEKIVEWIGEEEAAKGGGRAQSKKWEVSYDTDANRHVTAILHEATNAQRPMQQTRQPSFTAHSPQAPAQPKADRVTTTSFHEQEFQPRTAPNTTRLDELFKYTATKPVLYWQPVQRELANKRLDHIDDALSKIVATRRVINGDINRYTFEDGDVLVDRGPEIFPRIRPPPGHRGPSARGPRGGYRGRRGGFGSGSERNFDSYRAVERSDRRIPRDDWNH